MTETEAKTTRDSIQLENENLTLTIRDAGGCKTHFDIHISPQVTKKEWDKSVKSINKQVSLPGFRKGKAPDNLIVDRYTRFVEKEWREEVINLGFREAMRLSKIYPYNEEGIKPSLKSLTLEDGGQLHIEFERYPEIPEIDLTSIKLEEESRELVQKEEVEETIENIRLHHSKWEEVTDRPVQEGDYVVIDIEILAEKPFKVAEHSQFHVKEGKMGDWMRKLLIGAKAGDTVEGMSEKGPDVKEENFKPSQTRITLHHIKTAELPELDDELAKKVGAPSFDELKVRVEKDLNRQADDEVKDRLREQLKQKLVTLYPFDIPSSLVNEEKKVHLKKRLEGLKEQNLSNEELNKKREALEEMIVRDIQDAFRIYFLAGKIFRDRKISISSEELMQEVLKQSYFNPELRSAMQNNPEAVRERCYTNLMIRKAQDALIEAIGVSKKG